VEVQVPSDSVQVVFDVLYLFELPQHLHVLHFTVDHGVKGLNQLLP
jgi:hypothetical protein